MKKLVIFLSVAGSLYTQKMVPPGMELSSANQLAIKATDPTVSLMAFSFLGTYTGGFYRDAHGLPDDSWSLTFRTAIPFNFLDHPNHLRLTVPYQLSGRDQRHRINPPKLPSQINKS